MRVRSFVSHVIWWYLMLIPDLDCKRSSFANWHIITVLLAPFVYDAVLHSMASISCTISDRNGVINTRLISHPPVRPFYKRV